MIANLQEHYCKSPLIALNAIHFGMEGLKSDTEFVQALCRFAKMTPTQVARAAGLAVTTLTRPYASTATTRIGRQTFEKLRTRFPDFPGWNNEHPDQIGMHGQRADPNEKPDELIYVREIDVRWGMGEGLVVEDYPAVSLVPFNLNFIKAVTHTDPTKLFIGTGHGDSMEPTLLRSDLLMVDTSQTFPIVHGQVYAMVYNGGGAVKRLSREKVDGVFRYKVSSDNPLHEPSWVDEEDLHIVGRVVWVGRRM